MRRRTGGSPSCMPYLRPVSTPCLARTSTASLVRLMAAWLPAPRQGLFSVAVLVFATTPTVSALKTPFSILTDSSQSLRRDLGGQPEKGALLLKDPACSGCRDGKTSQAALVSTIGALYYGKLFAAIPDAQEHQELFSGMEQPIP